MLLELSADKRDLQAMARGFLAERCTLEFARTCDEAGRFPVELFAEIGDLGWLGIPHPNEYGGADGDALDEAVVVEQLGRAMGPLASGYVISILTCGKTLRDLGTHEQKTRWLPELISGEAMMSFALTEPEAGSDAAALRSRAVKVDNGWRLSGQKIFCTGATIARRLLVMARTSGDGERRAISMFVVDTDAPGVTIQPIPKLGLHPYPSCMIFFDEVLLDDDRLLGEPGQGWPHLLSSLNRERLAISAMCTGMAQAALDVAVEYAGQRRQFGVTIRDFDAVRRHVAEMTVTVETARALMLRSAALEAAGASSTLAASLAKIRTTDASVDSARHGMAVLGGYSYTMEYPMQRFLRDALIHPIAGGTNEIQRNIVAQELLRVRDSGEGALDVAVPGAEANPDAVLQTDGGLVETLLGVSANARSGEGEGPALDLGQLVIGALRSGSWAGAVDDTNAIDDTAGLLVAPDPEHVLAKTALRGTLSSGHWTVSGTCLPLVPTMSGGAGNLVLAPTNDGAVLLRVVPEDIEGGRAARLEGLDGVLVATVDASSARRVRAVLDAGAAAVLIGLADAGTEVLSEDLRSHRAGSQFAEDRWSGQALAHRLADLALLRESCRLELLRALDASSWQVAELHLAISLHEGLRAGRAAVEELERAAVMDGSKAGRERAQAAARTLAMVTALVGGQPRLRERISGYVFDAASRFA